MKTTTEIEDISMELQEGTNQYLTFMLGKEEYAVDILKIREIRGWESVTNIPNTPDYVLGVINLRGTVVPIIDLRRRFALDKADFGPTTVVIVTKVEHDGKDRTVGMVVDAVSEVYNIDEKLINAAPDVGGAISIDFIKGLATLDEKMLIILEIDELVNTGVLQDIGTEQ
jgi:purine-binding chemotaxis protein CheW